MLGSNGSNRTRAGGGLTGGFVLAVVLLAVAVAGLRPTPSPSTTGSPASTAPVATSAIAPAAGSGQSAAVRPAIAAADWPVYHLNSGRTGDYPNFPTLSGSLVAGWSTALDGAVYAEPLVVNGTVIAATEGDTVYALDPTTGGILWHTNLGTPVPLSSLPCGNIDPLGITGTPAYDAATDSIFVVAEVTGFQHVMSAINPTTGAVRWSRTVDLAGDDPRTHQQRTAMAVANGYAYFGFGGLSGDCGQYIGEVIGVPTSGSGPTISYVVPTSREGAVWATGGPVVDASGNLYVSVGNGASTTTYDGTDSVLELSPSLALLSRFAPTGWANDNANDRDLGSLSPVLVPGGFVFIAGKSGTGYVLNQGSLGGIGGQVSSASVCTGFGGASASGDTVFVPCVNSLREVQVGSNGSLTPGWQTSAAGGPPVLGGGLVWSVSSGGRLFALNPATGATVSSVSVGATPHFASPTLWSNEALVGTLSGVASVIVPGSSPTPAPSPAPTQSPTPTPSPAPTQSPTPTPSPTPSPTPTPTQTPSTYHPIAPTRILDTRRGTGGLSGPFSSRHSRTFQVTGGVVPTGASAVTGNLTVTGQTSGGFLYVGPNPADNPASSTLNFPVGDDRANSVTVALGSGGTLSVTYVARGPGSTAQVVFDVTGYFTPDPSGETFHPLTPHRLLDTRNGTGGVLHPLASKTPVTFTVTGAVVPAGARAVTGNLTVTGATAAGFVFLGSAADAAPTTSTINFPGGDTRANGVTLGLGPGGTLGVTYVGAGRGGTAQVIFDVTGYFTADQTGASYVPLTPARILDTRNGIGGISHPLGSHSPATFNVAGAGQVGSGAVAVTGNLTVVGPTGAGYLFLGPASTTNPTSSTLNFPAGDTRANGVTVGLGTGSLWVTFVATRAGNTAGAIFDVTGYYQ